MFHSLDEAQNGCREKKSTNTATQTFIEDIQEALDNKLLVMGIFLDLTKALYSIAGSCHPWLVSYGKGILIKKGLYCTLSFILCCAFLRVVDM
jgi:hypothetical protein